MSAGLSYQMENKKRHFNVKDSMDVRSRRLFHSLRSASCPRASRPIPLLVEDRQVLLSYWHHIQSRLPDGSLACPAEVAVLVAS